MKTAALRNIFYTTLLLATGFSFIVLTTIFSSKALAGASHSVTCGTYGTVTGMRLDNANISAPIAPGSYTLRWDPVRSIGGGTPGGIIDGRVWYHIDIDDLSTTTNPDFTVETPQYDNTPITHYSSYNFQGGKSYRWTIYGRGGCGFGPAASVTINSQGTYVLGRVATLGANGAIESNQFWSTSTSACDTSSINYPSNGSIKVRSERISPNPATSDMSINLCNPQPHYSTGNVVPGQRRLSVINIPSGYECSGWNYSVKRNGSYTVVAQGSGCATNTLTTNYLSANNDENGHHVWFFLKRTNTPTVTSAITPTRVPTATNTPTPTTSISCPIVPVDVMLVLDRSSSMWGQSVDGKTKLAWAKDAAKRFVNEFRATGATVRVGVASFAYDGRTHIAPRAIKTDTDYNAVISGINAIPTGHSRSCIECGIYEANTKLKAAGLNAGNTKTKKIVVVLSDGRANATRRDSSAGHDTAGNSAIAEAVRGRGNGKFGNVYGYNIMYFVNGYGPKVSDADGGIREWVLKGPAKDTSLGSLGIANGTGSPYYKYMDDPRNWDDIFNGFQDTICTMSAFRASAGEANQDVAGAQTGKITIDRATLIQKINEFVDGLMAEYRDAQ